jgi:hypothetical protein
MTGSHKAKAKVHAAHKAKPSKHAALRSQRHHRAA